MAEIAVKVIDPGGFRFAQLVEDDQPVRRVIALLVNRLDLPRELSYHLIQAATGRALDERNSLAGARVPPGAELLLQPARDTLFKALLDKLYDEAKGYVKDKIWDEAKDRLKKLFRLDPEYPDPQRLRDKIPDIRFPSNQADFADMFDPQARGKVATDPEGAPAAPRVPKSPPPVTLAEQPAASASSSAAGCFLVLVIVAGAAAVYWKPWELLTKKGPAPRPVVAPRGPAPQLGTGDVQVTLRWNNAADLDLHVVDPAKEEIMFGHRQAKSGGQLDVDANSSSAKLVPDPVENVFWPPNGAPRGEYQVWVNYYQQRNNSGPTNFTVTIKLGGRVQQELNGTISPGEPKKLLANFRY